MTITDIKVRSLINDGRLRAIISITLDDLIAIHDIKVVQGDGKFSFPCPTERMKTARSETSYTLFLPKAEGRSRT